MRRSCARRRSTPEGDRGREPSGGLAAGAATASRARPQACAHTHRFMRILFFLSSLIFSF